MSELTDSLSGAREVEGSGDKRSVSSITESPSLKTERDLDLRECVDVLGIVAFLLGEARARLLGEACEGPDDDDCPAVSMSPKGEALRNLAERIGWTRVLEGLASSPPNFESPLAGEL